MYMSLVVLCYLSSQVKSSPPTHPTHHNPPKPNSSTPSVAPYLTSHVYYDDP
ncbi:hypothetical protein GLYMA_03G198867v4 [Glycine max]|nr:hypothetical protein GLYMA_03G198867v4 [Glycine max]KAH1070916.1 hypothetical protein GYH30_007785 [Glycine max]